MGHVNEKLYMVRAEARGIVDAAARAWQGPGRERDLLVQSLKAAGAATLAWAVSGGWLKDPAALMAPWVAVVLVQATVYRSLFKGLQQLVAIAVGTLLAAGAEALTGNILISVAMVLPVVMLLSNWPRLGDQGIYGPTTALFTLTSAPVSSLTVSHRLLQALLGAAIGIAVNALIVPPVHLRNVRENLSSLARGAEGALAGMAGGLAHDGWSEETAADWRRLSDRLQRRQASLRYRVRGPGGSDLSALHPRGRARPAGGGAGLRGAAPRRPAQGALRSARRLHRHHRRPGHPAGAGPEHLASHHPGHLAPRR